MTDLSQELLARLAGRSSLTIDADEIRAVAEAFDYQDATIERQATEIESLLITIQRMNLIIKLARTYGLTPFTLPDRDEAQAFLRSYIDDGRYAAIPWPTELPSVAKAVAAFGYLNVGGFAERNAKVAHQSEKGEG